MLRRDGGLDGDFEQDCLGNERRGEGEGNSGPGDDGIGDVPRVALLDDLEVFLGIMNRRCRRNA